MKSKLLPTTLAILCFVLAGLGATAALADDGAIPIPGNTTAAVAPAQPDGVEDVLDQLDQRGENRCIQITVWAQNLETGECQEFSSPCSVPAGWTLYFDPATCTNW